MNKKGYYRFADIGMFILSFAIIAVGIGAGIFIFYSHEEDIRQQESNALFDKLIEAIIKEGRLDEEVFIDDFNIYEKANLNHEVINQFYYFKLEIFENGNLIKKIETVNLEFEILCNKGDKNPVCIKRDLILDNYRINIVAGSNQLGKRI